MKLAADLALDREVDLRCLPIEDADPGEFESVADIAFPSPPYFCREVYSDEETQSCNRYRTARDWCNGFLVPMMRFQFRAVKPGRNAIVNIADVKIGSKQFPLVEWTKRAACRLGFDFVDSFFYPLRRRFGQMKKGVSKKGVSVELVLVFKKPGEI